MDILRLVSVDSTNTYLKERFSDLTDLTVVRADVQTAGRGRLGRSWSGDGSSALFSILLKDDLDVATIARIPFVAAAAVRSALATRLRGLRVKWPNDIVRNGRKLCGILCESVIEGGAVNALVVGIGINVNTVAFPEDIQTTATSLLLETGRTFPVDDVVADVLSRFEAGIASLRRGEADPIADCDRHSALKGERIFFLQGGVRRDGIAGKIMPDGTLRVRTSEGVVFLRSGEATISGGMRLPVGD